MKGTILPAPDMDESLVIDLEGLQEIDHELFEIASFMTLGSSFGTVFIIYFIKIHELYKLKITILS
jgi:hypothetical protein